MAQNRRPVQSGMKGTKKDAAHAEVEAMLAMHKTDPGDHSIKYKLYAVGFVLAMIIIMAVIFIEALFG